MFESTIAILKFIEGRIRADLDEDRMLISGIVREFEIIGEAAGKVSPETQIHHPEIPWRALIGMRNRLIHAYFDIDHDIIWRTIHEELPSLKIVLERITSTL